MFPSENDENDSHWLAELLNLRDLYERYSN